MGSFNKWRLRDSHVMISILPICLSMPAHLQKRLDGSCTLPRQSYMIKQALSAGKGGGAVVVSSGNTLTILACMGTITPPGKEVPEGKYPPYLSTVISGMAAPRGRTLSGISRLLVGSVGSVGSVREDEKVLVGNEGNSAGPGPLESVNPWLPTLASRLPPPMTRRRGDNHFATLSVGMDGRNSSTSRLLTLRPVHNTHLLISQLW